MHAKQFFIVWFRFMDRIIKATQLLICNVNLSVECNNIWVLFQYRDHLSMYRDSHYEDKPLGRPPNLHNQNPYTVKTIYLYWDSPLTPKMLRYTSYSIHHMGLGNPHLEHYSDVIMGTMASQITSASIVYSHVCSGADQRKHQSSASLAFVRGIHQWPVNSPHKGPVVQKLSSFDDVIMGYRSLF